MKKDRPHLRRLRKVGNSQGVLLPAALLHKLGWGRDTLLQIKVRGGNLVLIAHTLVLDRKEGSH